VKRIEESGTKIDLVISATESTDGGTGTVPAQVGELLNWPALTFAKRVSVDRGKVSIDRQTEGGFDVVEVNLPAVVSVTANPDVEPRIPPFKGIMSAKTKPVDEPSLEDLGLVGQVGWEGARQEIVDIGSAPPRQAGQKIEDHDGDSVPVIVQTLEGLKVI